MLIDHPFLQNRMPSKKRKSTAAAATAGESGQRQIKRLTDPTGNPQSLLFSLSLLLMIFFLTSR